jgi:hypothetical protein
MRAEFREFVTERRPVLVGEFEKLREKGIEAVRERLDATADGVKAIKKPVHALAHSGIRLTEVSQRAAQSLIELQSEMVTSALTDAALRLQRASKADGLRDLVQEQAQLLGATRERIADEMKRAVAIFKVASRDCRKVGVQLYGKVLGPVEEELPKAGTRAVRKVKRTARKPPVH